MPLTFIDIERQKNWRIALLFVVLMLLYFAAAAALASAFFIGLVLDPVRFWISVAAISLVVAGTHFWFSAPAELKYSMPRVKDEINRSLGGEQQGLGGSGISAVDVRFRDMKRQMSFVQKRLVQVAKQRSLFRNQREKLDMPLVSLVGYTSSGKTTLFNMLASEEKEVASSLFTTLSTTTRTVQLPDSTKILLSDTVGFISRLPTYMIEAFKSTIDELIYANLVLLMVDASEPFADMQIKYSSCWDILRELKVPASKVVVVLNKSDLASDEGINHAKNLTAELPSVKISATRGDGTHVLKNLILQRISSQPIIH